MRPMKQKTSMDVTKCEMRKNDLPIQPEKTKKLTQDFSNLSQCKF